MRASSSPRQATHCRGRWCELRGGCVRSCSGSRWRRCFAGVGERPNGRAMRVGARAPRDGARCGVFVAATDTFVRGFMRTFSDMARRYHVYILGSSTQARFRESTDPHDIDLFSDPDLPRPSSVYVATGPIVYNTAFLW